MSLVFPLVLGLFASSAASSSFSSAQCLDAEFTLQHDDGPEALVLFQKGAQAFTKQGKMNSESAASSNITSNATGLEGSSNLLNNSQSISSSATALDRSTNVAESSHNDLANASLHTSFMIDVKTMIELELAPTSVPVKNKIILSILELLLLGYCGIDRCYMGQTCLGIIKGVTLGGLGIWAFLDYVTICIDCLGQWSSIDFMGIHATFESGTIMPAFWIVLIVSVLYVVGVAVQCVRATKT